MRVNKSNKFIIPIDMWDETIFNNQCYYYYVSWRSASDGVRERVGLGLVFIPLWLAGAFALNEVIWWLLVWGCVAWLKVLLGVAVARLNWESPPCNKQRIITRYNIPEIISQRYLGNIPEISWQRYLDSRDTLVPEIPWSISYNALQKNSFFWPFMKENGVYSNWNKVS